MSRPTDYLKKEILRGDISNNLISERPSGFLKGRLKIKVLKIEKELCSLQYYLCDSGENDLVELLSEEVELAEKESLTLEDIEFIWPIEIHQNKANFKNHNRKGDEK